MRSDWTGPVNIGSEEMVTINQLATLAARVADKRIAIRHIPGPLGVRGRRSDNQLIFKKLQWKPSRPLEYGIRRTYGWIEEQVRLRRKTTSSEL
jgi:nucleoside-diphosphate-sugar epimerase